MAKTLYLIRIVFPNDRSVSAISHYLNKQLLFHINPKELSILTIHRLLPKVNQID